MPTTHIMNSNKYSRYYHITVYGRHDLKSGSVYTKLEDLLPSAVSQRRVTVPQAAGYVIPPLQVDMSLNRLD